MRNLLGMLWESLSISVSWLPPFCRDFLVVVGTLVIAFIVIPIVVKIVQFTVEAIR